MTYGTASYSDPEDFSLFGVLYKGTRQQANAIWFELMETPQWLEFDALDTMLERIQLDHIPQGWSYSEQPWARHSTLYRWLSRKAHELIQKHTA